jgi:hypothetical protein
MQTPSPGLSVDDFDRKLSDLTKDLETNWYKIECLSLDDQLGGSGGSSGMTTALGSGSGLYGNMPQIDSKVVSKASPIIEKHLGFKLPLDLIRRGGYESFNDLMADLAPKLRDLCKSKPVNDNTSSQFHPAQLVS